jgi:hypothetical protein
MASAAVKYRADSSRSRSGQQFDGQFAVQQLIAGADEHSHAALSDLFAQQITLFDGLQRALRVGGRLAAGRRRLVKRGECRPHQEFVVSEPILRPVRATQSQNSCSPSRETARCRVSEGSSP